MYSFILYSFIQKGPNRADAHTRSPSGQRWGAHVTTFDAEGKAQGAQRAARLEAAAVVPFTRGGRPSSPSSRTRFFELLPPPLPLPPPSSPPTAARSARARSRASRWARSAAARSDSTLTRARAIERALAGRVVDVVHPARRAGHGRLPALPGHAKVPSW